jgi:hypothetical protein
MFYEDTDPYGSLEFVIGIEDDFWCFDYAVDEERKLVRLHAVVNSETGGFIQNAEDPIEVPFSEAVQEAQRLVDEAINWMYDSGEPVVEHDEEGWNQDTGYFVRAVHGAVTNTGPAIRKAVKMEDPGPLGSSFRHYYP